MGELFGSALVLAMLVGLLVFIVRGWPRGEGGRRWSSFNLRRAGTGFSMSGYLAVGTLATVATVQGLIDVGPMIGQSYVPSIAITIVAAAVALAMAPAPTLVLLSVAGIALQALSMLQSQGAESGLVVVVLSVAAVWLSGAVRGFLTRG